MSPFFTSLPVATGGDHHVLPGVDSDEPLAVHPEQAVAGGSQLDLALLRLTADHVLLTTQGQQPLRRIVFVDHARSHLPDIQVLLAHAQENGNIVLCDDVALAEPGVLILVLDDLAHIMAQHVAHGLLCSD